MPVDPEGVLWPPVLWLLVVAASGLTCKLAHRSTDGASRRQRTALRAVNGRRFAPPPPAPSCRCSPDTPSLSPLLGFMCHVHARRMVPRPGLANKFAAHFLWHVPICSASLLCKLHATVGAGPAAARKATVLTSKVARQRSSWFATQPPWSGKA